MSIKSRRNALSNNEPTKPCSKCPGQAEYVYKTLLLCGTCIGLVAADAPIVRINKKRPQKKFSEVETSKNYSGEASPYWDHMKQKPWVDEGGHPNEVAEGNPDVLGEDASPYHGHLTDEGEAQLDVLEDVMEELTPLQRRVLELSALERPSKDGVRRHTEEEVARDIGITRLAVRTILDRIRKTTEEKYKQRKKSARFRKEL